MSRLSWPNRVTLARILLIAPFVIALMSIRESTWARWAALGIFFLMAVSDALDGWLARRWSSETPLGKFLDPLADKVLITCAVVLLGHHATCVPGKAIPHAVVVVAIGKDLFVVTGFLLVYLVTGRIYIEARRAGKWCTGLQLAMVVAVLLWPELERLGEPLGRLPDLLWWSATGVALIAAVDYYRLGTAYAAKVGEATAADSDSANSEGKT
ncbi:MAG: CDP-alcohol phosphatidyltransferase family protein [Phycisphaerae bacterium]|nr:CDP-alcohol phosphatidyltransferase family protein [Phycisphaerae bacterium]